MQIGKTCKGESYFELTGKSIRVLEDLDLFGVKDVDGRAVLSVVGLDEISSGHERLVMNPRTINNEICNRVIVNYT